MRWVALLIVLASAPAWGQSKRYPPEPADKDEQAAMKSKLWDAATNPQRTPYETLTALAQQQLDERRTDSWLEAVKKLDEAVKLVPDDGRAFALRAEAHMLLKDWSKCAADFDAAWRRVRTMNLDGKKLGDLRRGLGLCQARAGKLADAERTLSEAAVTGAATGELWMRLGEVRIAMGKLEEAIAALESVAESPDAPQALVRWLLAGAYDRARRPGEAVEAAKKALSYDRDLKLLADSDLAPVPLLGVGESAYLLGLAYSAFEPAKSEYALAYFRKFVRAAATSPWRKRADDHIKELRASELPEVIERRGGNAPLDVVAARAIVRRAIGPMRACAAKLPTSVFEVQITRGGPRTPTSARERPRFFAPPDGAVTEFRVVPGDAPRAELDAAIRCIEPIASRLVLPPVKEKDAWYKVAFYVGAP